MTWDLMRSATADWIGSDSPNKPDHYKTVWGFPPHLRKMHSGDYLARNVKLARQRLSWGVEYPSGPHCVGPEHDH